MNMSSSSKYTLASHPRKGLRPQGLPALALVLAAASATGCYHATGYQRPTVVSEEIPAEGGARVSGLKSAGGPGDYHMGNDFLNLVVDGTPFGAPEGSAVAGAVSGGSIIDIGYVALDNSFLRVSMPGDSMERLTPVVNQDPDLPVVFSTYQTSNQAELSVLEMRGGVLDAKGKLGVPLDGQNRVRGVEAIHRIRLEKLGRYFLMETTLVNNSQQTLPLRSLGDHLYQRGAGFRFSIPAFETQDGQVVTDWGRDLPGTDFSRPLQNSVKARQAVLYASEPGDVATDLHTSLGIVADDFSPVLVASDPQKSLTSTRPVFPSNLVVGRLPMDSLKAGEKLTWTRRLYIMGGGAGVLGENSSQATSMNGLLTAERAVQKKEDLGFLSMQLSGTVRRTGYLPGEVRIERNEGTGAAPRWVLQRLEWWEPSDLPSSNLTNSMSLTAGVPPGTYRLVVSNAEERAVIEKAVDDNSANGHGNLELPIKVTKEHTQTYTAEGGTNKIIMLGARTRVMAERDRVIDPQTGSLKEALDFDLVLSARPQGDVFGSLQPIRFTVSGRNGTPDPVFPRGRAMAGTYDPIIKANRVDPRSRGIFQFWGGNRAFGVNTAPSSPINLPIRPGKYDVLATRGPLGPLDMTQVELGGADSGSGTRLIAFNPALPEGWKSLDQPGPSTASDGGLHPAEMLGSALAEGVQVLVLGEKDRNPDARGLRAGFREEIDFPEFADYRKAVADDPMVVGGRTSDLGAFGLASSWFTPAADAQQRRNGARLNLGWTLADFIAQGAGSFVVVHRPRDPKQGLFARQGFNPTQAIGTGANAWMTQSSSLASGRRHGDFDALELLRGEGLNPQQPDAWFTEFLQVRQDWFALLNQQLPTAFTKALGLSAARFSQDTPVGLARTYVKTEAIAQDKQAPLQAALKAGAAVASTGPLLDVTVNGKGPGTLATGASLTVQVNLYAPAWVPVEEVRLVVNGQVVRTLPASSLTQDATDPRKRSGTVTLDLPTTKDAWVVVEAGVPLATRGAYRPGSPWHQVMSGIYPVAVANPVFVDVNGGGYTAPGL